MRTQSTQYSCGNTSLGKVGTRSITVAVKISGCTSVKLRTRLVLVNVATVLLSIAMLIQVSVQSSLKTVHFEV